MLVLLIPLASVRRPVAMLEPPTPEALADEPSAMLLPVLPLAFASRPLATFPRASVSQDIDDIAVIEDDGTLLLQPNPFDLGNVGLQYAATNERLKFLANYRVSRDAIDTTFISTVPLPDYELLDLSVSFDASELLQIYGRVQNATDETYEEVVGYNTAGRSIYGGVRLRF